MEALRYVAPGEWGKLLGLDRIPEVRTLREKLSALCSQEGRAQHWSHTLAREWMEAEPESAGVLYVDGHVRIYHGKLTALPRRYIARQRLCLRGTTDYWVNAMDGSPFFVITRSVDAGLIKVLREEIIPRLKADVPGQPSEPALAENPLLSRFTLVFDREGYSPEFFAELKKERIAVLTYRKFPGEDWPEAEFELREVTLVHGEKVIMDLAERGVCLSNGLWMRETINKHVPIKELSESQRFSQLRFEKKHFIDTIKLIAYRAETAMAQLAREQMHRLEDARALMRQLYRAEADLIPNPANKTLTVRLHPLRANVHDHAIRHLCEELNASETIFPGTDLRLGLAPRLRNYWLTLVPLDQEGLKLVPFGLCLNFRRARELGVNAGEKSSRCS